MCPNTADIRSSIVLFIKLLRHFGFSTPSAEEFRLAKYNDSRATHSLLRLLYEFLYFYQYDSVDHTCLEGFDKFSLLDVNIHITKKLRNLGYCSPYSDFNIISSRELLIKIGWVFCRCNLLHKLEGALLRGMRHPGFELTSFPTSSDTNVSLSELILLLGRLRLRMKELCLTRSGILKQNLLGSHKNRVDYSFTPMECLMINSPSTIENHARFIEEISAGLSLLLSWQCSSRIFWQWMQSVMILQFSADDGTISPISDSAIKRLHKLQVSFDDHLQHFASSDYILNTPENKPTHFPVCEQSTDHLLSQIDIDLWNLSAQLEWRGTMLPPFLAPLRWIYAMTPDSESSLRNEKVELTKLSDECKMLTAALQSARERNNRLRDEMTEYLNKFAAQCMPDVLFLHSSIGSSEES